MNNKNKIIAKEIFNQALGFQELDGNDIQIVTERESSLIISSKKISKKEELVSNTVLKEDKEDYTYKIPEILLSKNEINEEHYENFYNY